MKALVLGGGIIGVTTAYELLRDGWEVTVVERLEAPAMFTSHANAGLVACGHAYTWASPSAPKIMWKSLFDSDQALRFRPNLDPALWRWTWKFLRNCSADKAARNTTRKVGLCRYSQDMLHRVVGETGVTYDGRTGGLIYFYRKPESFETGVARLHVLTDNGVKLEVLDAAGAALLDPALAPVKDQIAGAIYAPTDESGDACIFTQALARKCTEMGAMFKFSTSVTGFDTEGDRVAAVLTDKGRETADAVVLALGVYSPHLARQLGADLPVYPVKGYSVTVPVAGRNNPPRLGGVDEDNLVAYCPMGDRIRITATAEFAGYDTSHKPGDFRYMLSVARALFPEGADYSAPTYWAGLRPMTPEGTPIFGRGRHANLWFNTGQGHMGWTMSCGSARVTADLMAGRTPAIDLTGMQYAA
jgi:D-amino-acid dehydrogenase